MKNGKILLFKADRGYGFIEPEDGTANVYVHKTILEKAGIEELVPGQTVSYELHTDADGKTSAINIQVLDDEA